MAVSMVSEYSVFRSYYPFTCTSNASVIKAPSRPARFVISGGRYPAGLTRVCSLLLEASRQMPREAAHDGAPPIDLVDGDRLCELLRTLRIRVSTRMVEEVLVGRGWFTRL